MDKPPIRSATTAPVHIMAEAIRNLLREARTAATHEECLAILSRAITRFDSLVKRVDPARFGKKGGMATAERGPEYFRQIAAMRKTRAGGRPKKQADQTS